MALFIALPVARGDAFYLEREGFSLLIDGGGNRCALPSIFRTVTKANGVDVLVCTHNDADHANGILGFLESSLRCQEVWLPGRWLRVLPDVLRPFGEVLDELVKNISELENFPNIETQHPSPSPLEIYAESAPRLWTEAPPNEKGPLLSEDGWPGSCLQMLEQAEPWKVPFTWIVPWHLHTYRYLSWRFHRHRTLMHATIKLLMDSINAASRIRAIAIKAFHRRIPVRWFEFDTIRPSGGVSALQPLNAREVTRVPRSVGILCHRLALTVWNKESLVFWSPPTEYHSGVLFTADSDLNGVILPSQLDRCIATAPHHGSEANANAYRAVGLVAKNGSKWITWVRSDGRYRNRPGNTYVGLASRRLCTLSGVRSIAGRPSKK